MIFFHDCSLFIRFCFSEKEEQKVTNENDGGGTSQGLIVLAVVFSIFGLLVIVFMIYIVRRVRYRHLYMQVSFTSSAYLTCVN